MLTGARSLCSPISMRDRLLNARRRRFLVNGVCGAFGALLTGPILSSVRGAGLIPFKWSDTKNLFRLSDNFHHFSAMLLSSHPTPVRQAIERYRNELDLNPSLYSEVHNQKLQDQVAGAAARYLGAKKKDIALTDSTTMGLGILYNGIHIRSNQEILTTEHDHRSTHLSLQYKVNRTGANMRKIRLYKDYETEWDHTTGDQLTERVIKEISDKTRVLALTWVHSSTGVKLPIAQISKRVQKINRERDHSDQILVCIDGVHGLGVENFSLLDLGCDFFVAGTHKWMFGPRGTGILWGKPNRQSEVEPTIPNFRSTPGWGSRMSPGGFKSFEHLWATTEAFSFHERIGKTVINNQIKNLATALKSELAKIDKVNLYTPKSPALSAGIVCFGVKGMSTRKLVEHMQKEGHLISDSPYSPSHSRFSLTVFNTMEEIDSAISSIKKI